LAGYFGWLFLHTMQIGYADNAGWQCLLCSLLLMAMVAGFSSWVGWIIWLVMLAGSAMLQIIQSMLAGMLS
jgi:hypothetical protein